MEEKRTLRCGNQVMELNEPRVMGIINATPDSFYAPSRTGILVEKAVEKATQMVSEGASFLDVGGMSTRPGANEISEEEELSRVIPVIGAIHSALPEAILSIDTYRSGVANEACKAGATMINDVSGGQADEQIFNVAAEFQAAYLLMHRKGTSKTMQKLTDYEDLIPDLIKFFVNRLRVLHRVGVDDVLIDPGFGFAKSTEQNYHLIRHLNSFKLLGHPILVGLSRKSTLSKTIGRPTEETLFATTALHMAALQNGASILRVHDVRPAMDTIAVYKQLTLT